MVSPLAKQRKQLLEMQANQSAPETVSGVDTDSLHIKLIEFEEDRKHLRSFNAIADRIEHKRNVLVPKYKPYVQRYLESGDQFENPIFTNVVIWLFDIKELDVAIDWCMKAIERDLPTPENFRRDWPTFCADEVLAWAEHESERGNSIEPYFSQVFEKVEKEWRLHEKVHAKWYKFAGLFLIRNEQGNPQATAVGDVKVLEKALALLNHAHEKHCKVGVGTQVKKIEQRIRAINDGKNL
ncbi:phage terminase small subunit [Vibrio sp. 10N.222.51.C12]|uniref:phage terminase small subunit n=1 Tax=Vibrio sp. 10N.222.51.C12 TaxID=3229622 RepID=UPI00355450E8